MNLLQFFSIVLVAAIVVCSGCDSPKKKMETERDIGTVLLEVNFGDQKPSKSIDVVCSPDSTVLLSLERAQQLDKLKFQVKGSGETAFLESIDGVANSAENGKYWTYRVNETLGDKSAGVFAVKPADKITWTFGDRPKELK